MVIYMYIAPGQGQTTPWAQYIFININLMSICSFLETHMVSWYLSAANALLWVDAFIYGVDTFVLRFRYGNIRISAFSYMSLRIITDVSSVPNF